MSFNKPRNITIHDVKSVRPNSSNLKKINPREISKSIRSEYGIEPEVEDEVYDSYVDQIVKTVGYDMADEMFETAKNIIYTKALDIQVDDDSREQIKEHTTKADDIPVESMNVKITQVPGPKRKNRRR